MFSSLKVQIKELAKNAVLVAETELGSGRGQEKKKMAVDYVVNNLNCTGLLKIIVSVLLSGFIDDVVEISVKYVNSLAEDKENK